MYNQLNKFSLNKPGLSKEKNSFVIDGMMNEKNVVSRLVGLVVSKLNWLKEMNNDTPDWLDNSDLIQIGVQKNLNPNHKMLNK